MLTTKNKEARKFINKSKSIIEHIKKVEMEIKQYWIPLGLTEEEVELLIQMEIDEESVACSNSYYLNRKVKYDLGMVSIDDIKYDIERYRKINKFRFEYIG